MDESFGKRLQKARREKGFSSPKEAIASHPSWNLHTYKAHEVGHRVPRDIERVKEYAKEYRVRWQWLAHNDGPMREERNIPPYSIDSHKNAHKQSQMESSSPYPLNVFDTIPLYGPASAGTTKIYITEGCVIGEEPRPPGLQNVKGGFMMLVTGDCMEPRIMHGEKVWVHPYRVPVLNDDCVLVMEPEGNAELKRYLGENKDEFKFMQLNPPAKFSVQKKNVRNLFTVIGYSRY